MKTRIHILAQVLILLILGNLVAWGQVRTDYRSHQDGDWSEIETWEEYIPDKGWIYPASQAPLKNHEVNEITVQRPHKVTISSDVMIDDLVIYGTLAVKGSLSIISGTIKPDLYIGLTLFPIPKSGRIENCGNITVLPGAKVDAWRGEWQNYCSNSGTAVLSTNSLGFGSINNFGEIQMGSFAYSGGSVRGNPFLYDPSSAATLVLEQAADDTSMATFWPATNGPANITVKGNVTLNGARTIRGTLQLEGSSAVINNLGEILIEGTFLRGLGSGSLIGNALRYGANGSLTISNRFNDLDVIDSLNLFWPAINGPANVTILGNVTLKAKRTLSGTLNVPLTFHVVDTLITNGTTKVTGGLYVVGTLINNGTIQALTGGVEVSGKLTNNGVAQLNFFTLNPGGVVSGKDFVYDKTRGGTLILNTSYNINDSTPFWPRQNAPANVTISNSINVTVNAARSVSGGLQIIGTLQVADTLTTNTTVGGGTLQVDGALIANGKTSIKTLLVNGTATNYGTMENYGTYQVSGTLTNHGTITSYGPCEVSGTLINNGTQSFHTCKVSGTFTNNAATQINFTFQLEQGGAANGSDFTYGGNGTLVFNNSSGVYDVGSGSVFWPINNGPANVILQGAGGIKMNVARTVQQFETAVAVTNADSLTITGTVVINAGGAFDAPLIYESAATLSYGANGAYHVGMEWGSGTAVGAGVPMNVMINNGATVNMPSSPRTCPGYLRNYGTLALNTTPGADLSVGGDWENYGIFEPNSRAVIFNGTTEQTLGPARQMNTFDYLTVNNPAGILVEGQPEGSEVSEEIASVTVQQALTFIAGNLRLRWGHLTLSGSVSGVSSNRHVVTYEKGRVVRAIAADSSFQFPVGPTETSYNPLTISLAPTDTTETFSVRVDSTINIGAPEDSLFVQRTWDIQEETPGDNHAALTFQWAKADEGKKFLRNVSYAYLDNAVVARNSSASGTNPYFASTTPGFPCTEFSLYTVGTPENVTAVKEPQGEIPKVFMLGQNYPNPFNPATTIRYATTKPGQVLLKIYNLAGKEIEVLVNEKQPAGEHKIRWNPIGLPSGVYFYRLQAGEFTATKKLILLQ